MKDLNINTLSLHTFFIIALAILVQPLTAQNTFSVNSSSFTGFQTPDMAVADIDGDNDQDVIICGTVSSAFTTELYKNDGSGNFTKVNGTGLPNFYGDVAFGDIDGDNDQDLIWSGYNGATFQETAELYTNDGSGNFTKVNGTPFLGGFNSQVAFIDVDGDNDQDIIIIAESIFTNSNNSRLYLNNGSGTYTMSTTLASAAPDDLVVGDIDGDNDMDFYLSARDADSDGQSVSSFYINDGTGSFSAFTTSITQLVFGDVDLVDLDSDNDLDFVQTGKTSGTNRTTEVYTNNGSGTFTKVNENSFVTGLSGLNTFAIVAADIDGDNDMDLVLGQEDAGGVYINDGSNVFYLDNSISLTYDFKKAIFFDANGDNLIDFITTGNASTKLYNNNFTSTNSQKSLDFDGTNTYQAAHHSALNTLPMTIEFWIKTTTINQDGLMDKLIGTNGFQVYIVNGQMVFSYVPSSGNSTEFNQVFTVNDDVWHHVAIVVDNSGTKLYGDGVLLSTTGWIGTAAAISNTTNLRIGRATNTAGSFFPDLLDEVRIWNTARTATEIRQNMYLPIANPAANANLVAYYNMNEYINNTSFIDKSSTRNTLTITGGNITLGSELINYKNAATNVNNSVQNTTATIGNFTFDDASANGNDPFDAATEIVVAKVTGAPNVTTGITEANKDNQYYIIQLYNGAGTYSVDLSINCGFPNGSAVSLYRRDDHSTDDWTLLSSGTVVGGKAVFNNITSFSQLMLASSASLPVELLSFTASAKNESIQLDWSVGIEDNLSHYEIERSTDGRDFENTGSVSAKDWSFYEYQDYDVYKNETYYYRLKAIDLDGSYEYSSIVHATIKQSSNQTINIFPNPTSDILNIQIEGENAYISLHDQTGRMIRNYQPTESNFQINMSDLPNGIYYATIMVDGLHTVKKLIKQ